MDGEYRTNLSIDLGGPLFILFCVFVVLKLTHVIAWSWWWVTAPLWGGIALVLLIACIAIAIYVFANR